MTVLPDSLLQETAWNGVRLQCPANWDVIVRGDSHLLFEHNFTPYLELRWPDTDSGKTHSARKLLDNLKQQTGLFPARSIPPGWKKVRTQYDIHLLLQETKETPQAALLICKTCKKVLLFYFFPPLPADHNTITTLFDSLQCHPHEGGETVWAIQDIRFTLPEKCALSSYTFDAGLTRITFSSGSRIIHLCRLAPASHRLQSADLGQLLIRLGDLPLEIENIEQDSKLASHSSHPSIFKQVLSRLKRKLPFHEMYLRHHQDCDRLTGLFILDKKPIPKTYAEHILNHYEIIQL